MGKRKHKRRTINHPAILMLKDGIRIDCSVLNFSYGGLFLTASNQSALNLPPGTVVKIQLKTQRDIKEVQISAVHAHEGGLGVAFINDESELLRYLQRASTTPNLQHQKSPGYPQQNKIGAKETTIIKWIHSTTERFLKSLYSEFIKSAYNDLFDAAHTSDNNQTQSLLFDAYNALQQNQDEIERLFLNNIESSFKKFSKGKFSDHTPGEDLFQESEMELVAKEDFEEWVSVVSLTRSLDPETSSKLHLLENSLSFLAKRYISNENNPVSPYSLLWSLKKAFANIDITLQAKKVLFSSFQKNILGEVGSLLEDINLHLDMKGITQQAQQESTKSEKPKKPAPVTTEPSPQADSGIGKRLTDTLSSLLGFVSKKSTTDPIKTITDEALSKEQIVQSLANISSVGQRSIINKIEDQLSDVKINGRPGIIDNDTRQTIHATEQLLGSLQQDSYINPKIGELIESLKIPLVKEAINNPMLLNDASHPGHKLLDAIGKLGPYLAVDKQSSRNKGVLYQAVEEISKLAEKGTQLDIQQVTNHLEQIIDQRKNNLKSNLGIIAKSCEQDEQYREARKTVYKLLCSKLTHREMPLVVEQLLHLGWVGLLVHAISTFGNSDKRVIRLSGVVDLLLDIFSSEQKLKPMTTIQSEYMVKVIKGGFAKYPLFAQDAKQYLTTLEEILESGGAKHSEIATQRVTIDKSDIKRLLNKQTAVQPDEAPSPDIEKSWLDLVAGIKLDDWIVEQSKQGHARMLNLAWKNQDSTRFVFVDGEGDKKLDTKHRQLAYMFKQRKCSLLEDGSIPIVERAVDRLLKNTFDQIKNESDIDHLTGLLRRTAFQKRISDLIKITNDVGDQHIALKLDIDKFSAINDQCGQKGGDKLLQTVSNILKNYLPEHATLARTGSDEFGVLLKNCSLDEGYYLAETLRRAIENLRYTWDGAVIPATVSVGIANINTDTASAAEAMNMANSACQMAINDGGNCSKLFSITDSDSEQLDIIASDTDIIEETLKDQKLALFAQPVSAIFLGDEEEHHYEILLRVKGRNGDWLGPSKLINAAEKRSRMRSVDRWVINKTFSWLGNHHNEINNTSISINLSAQSMEDDNFFTFISDHLDSSPFPNNKITFEITETSLIKNIDKASMLVEKIKEKGCKFSLDDFGTGYASYSYLKDFPVDNVKIDGVFIKDILTESSSYAMVKSITDVSHYMGKKVVAEYVESEAILGALRELEVDFAQGYYVGHPVPIQTLLQA